MRAQAFVDALLERLEWACNAACKGRNPELFFPERGSDGLAAKQVCATCSVRGECLWTALQDHEPTGIWGGLTYRERDRIPREDYDLEPEELEQRYPIRLRRRTI